MYRFGLLLIVSLLLSTCLPVSVQAYSVPISCETIIDTGEPEGFEPGLFLFAMAGLVFILCCTGVVIAISLLVLVAITGMVAAGIISASIWVGIHKRSVMAGFSVLIIAGMTVTSTIAVTGIVYIINRIMHWWPVSFALPLGMLSGAIVGITAGRLTVLLIRRISRRLATLR